MYLKVALPDVVHCLYQAGASPKTGNKANVPPPETRRLCKGYGSTPSPQPAVSLDSGRKFKFSLSFIKCIKNCLKLLKFS